MPINCNITSVEELQEKKQEWKKEAVSIFKGNATSYQISTDGFKIRIPWGKGSEKIKTKENANGAASSAKARVIKWASEKFGHKFSDWVSIYDSNDGYISARIGFPNILNEAYLMKIGNKEIVDDKGQHLLFNLANPEHEKQQQANIGIINTLKGKSNIDILEYLYENETWKPAKAVAKAMMNNANKLDALVDFKGAIKYTQEKQGPTSFLYYAIFDPKEKAISFNIDLIGVRNADELRRALIHEYLHAFTVYAEEKKTNIEKNFFENIERIYEDLKNSTNYPGEYGFSSPLEFITAIMTNPEFLRKISNDGKNYIQRFIDAIKKLLGVEVINENKENVNKAIETILNFIPISNPEATDDSMGSIENQYQTPSKNQETIDTLKKAMASLGATIETTNSILQEYGANAVIDLSNKLIQIVEGKENAALTEEAMHMISALLPEGMLKNLLDVIKEYNIYKLTLNQYKKHPAYQNRDGSINEEKMKFEAVGKLLAEYYIREAENLSDKEVNIAKDLWHRILDWIKNVFSVHKDGFQNIINKLNKGELELSTESSRQDKFYQLIFGRTEANELAEVISRGYTKEDITKENKDPNVVKLFKLKELIEYIKRNDLPLINSFRQNIKLTGSPFAEANRKIDNARSAIELLDSASNSINYFLSLASITKNLQARSKEITGVLKSGIIDKNINGVKTPTPITEDDKFFLSLEIVKIDKANEIYISELQSFSRIWLDDDMIEMKEVIGNISKIASDTILYNERVHKSILRDVLSNVINPKREKYIEEKRRTKTELQLKLPKLKGKDREIAEKKINLIEQDIANPPFSVDSVIDDLTENVTNTGLQGIQDFVAKMMEPGQQHKDTAVQAVVNTLEDAHRFAKREADVTINKIRQLFDKYKKKLNLTTNTYDKFLKSVRRYSYDETKGELISYEELVLVNSLEQWKFDDQTNTLRYLREKANKIDVSVDHLKDVYRKVFEKELPESTNYATLFSDLQKDLYRFAQDQYTKEYRDIQSLLDIPLSTTKEVDGRTISITVRDIRREYTQRLQLAQDDLNNVIGDSTIEEADVVTALKELQLLGSKYDKGIKKTGDSLIIAEAITKWQEAKLKKNNNIADIDIWFIPNDNRARWQEQKDQADSLDPDSKARWYRVNTISETKKEYTTIITDLYSRIANILERNGRKSERVDDLISERGQLVKGYRDNDGIIIGTEFSPAQVEQIKDVEKEIEYARSEAFATSSAMPQAERLALQSYFKQIDAMRNSSVTEYWEDRLEDVKSSIPLTLSKQEYDEALQKSDFIKENTIDVTQEYRNYLTWPDNIVKIGNRFYSPIYIWKQTTPKAEWVDEDQPSFKWKTYRVANEFKNKDHETIQGEVALNPLAENVETFYGSQEHGKLDNEDKDFLSEFREEYYSLQREHPEYERLGDSLPKAIASGTQRNKQRLLNSKYLLTNFFTKEYWNNIANLTPTSLEQEFGEGKSFQRDKDLQVNTKFASKNIPVRRQDRDLFNLIGMYTIETKRTYAMRRLLPALNTVKKMLPAKTSRSFSIEKEIDKRVNKVTKLDEGGMRIAAKLQSRMFSILGLTRVGLPNLSQVAKNTVNGIWQISVNSPYLKQFSKSSITRATLQALKSAGSVTFQKFSSVPSKEMAILRRLDVITDLTTYDITSNQKDFLLKSADALTYTLGGAKRFSEAHLELIAFELIKSKYKSQTGHNLYDDYSYINGELLPINGLTKEKENELTKETLAINQFVHGNFKGDNSPLAKMYFVGRLLTFMKGFVYNPIMKRYGKKRILPTGQEMEGFYRIYARIVKENPKGILLKLSTSSLTPQEKGAVWSMYKDFIVVNAIGIAMYNLASILKESGDDDDEAYAEWYTLMLSRKIYSEMSYFNPVEYVGKPIDQLFVSEKPPGKRFKNFMTYQVINPAVNLGLQSFLPFDYKNFAMSSDELQHEKDPFYSQFKDNVALFDLFRLTNSRPDVFYPKKALKGFELYDRSIYQYEK